MGLTSNQVAVADGTRVDESDREPLSAQLAQEATARMFRSVRAGRLWVRGGGGPVTVPQIAGCFTLKPGNDRPPVFMIPGAPGSILQLGPLAAALPLQVPVYAIQPRGLREEEIPCESIEEMAQHNIGVLGAVQPQGPYLLIGYSVGGLVALEMARQLSAAGRCVPLIVLLDTFPRRKTWPLRCHLEIVARQTAEALWSLARYSPSEAITQLSRRFRNLLGYLAASGLRLVPAPAVVPKAWSTESRRLYLASVAASEAYRPSRYSGKVVFVQPEEITGLEPRSPAQVWRRFLADLEVRRVSGSHIGMVEGSATATAAVIAEYIERVLPFVAHRY